MIGRSIGKSVGRSRSRARLVDAALLVASLVSLTAILSLRLYAAWTLPALHTPWDDDFYRIAATSAATSQSSAVTAYNLALPH